MTHNTAGFKQNFRMEPESDLGGLQTTIRGMKPTKVGVVYGYIWVRGEKIIPP